MIKNKWNEVRMILMLFVFVTSITTIGLAQKKSKEKTKGITAGVPVFSNFSYKGNDKVYTDNPLQQDEFYNPILQGCYPDPSMVRRGDDYFP